MTFAYIVGISAGILSLAAYLLYNVSILRGKTKPNRATWWILTLVGIIILVSYYQGGARETIWVPLAYVVGPLMIALLSLKYGEGKWERLDKFCLAGALVGLALWFIFDNPLIALLINLAIDFLGLLPTIIKSYLRPHGEDRTAWVMEAVSSVLNLFAVSPWIFEIWIYPVYLAVVNGLVAILLVVGRMRKQ